MSLLCFPDELSAVPAPVVWAYGSESLAPNLIRSQPLQPTAFWRRTASMYNTTVVSQHIWHSLRPFTVAGPTVWNSMPDSLRDSAVESERVSAGLENASLCRRTLET